MKVNEYISRSAKFLNIINIYPGVSIHTLKDGITMGFLNLALEHHSAILTLVSGNHYCSAAALLRPQFEAFIRGVWIYHCKNDESEIKKIYTSKNGFIGVKRCVKEIIKFDPYKSGELSAFTDSVINTMHNLTHGGNLQVAAKTANYSEKQILEMLQLAGVITKNVFLEWAYLLQSNEMKRDVLSAYNSLFLAK